MLLPGLSVLVWSLGAQVPSPDFFPLQPGNQWVLEAEDGSGEILNIQVHRSRLMGEFTYYLVSGYAPSDVWVRQTAEGEILVRNTWTGDEEKMAHLGLNAPAYETSLSGCTQEARPAEGKPGLPGLLNLNYAPGSCRDAGLVEEQYESGVGLLRRTMDNIRGATTYLLAYARVGDRTILPKPKELLFHYTFSHGASGWLAGFSDYGLMNGDMHFLGESRVLPDGLAGDEQQGFFLQSMNRSDDMFMFLKKGLFLADGLKPNQSYSLSAEITLASNAQTGCFGVGGAPGEGVYLKAGASADEPVSVLASGQHLELQLDKGHQAVGGRDAGIVSNIANGDPCDSGNARYVRMWKNYEHGWPVFTDDRAQLWLIVGTDSAYEGLTGLYFESITVRLRENEVSIYPSEPRSGLWPRNGGSLVNARTRLGAETASPRRPQPISRGPRQ